MRWNDSEELERERAKVTAYRLQLTRERAAGVLAVDMLRLAAVYFLGSAVVYLFSGGWLGLFGHVLLFGLMFAAARKLRKSRGDNNVETSWQELERISKSR